MCALPARADAPQYIFGSSGALANVTQLANVRALNASKIDPPSLFQAQLEDRLGKKEVSLLHTTFLRAAASVPMAPMDQWTANAAFEWPAASIAAIAAEPTGGASSLAAPSAALALLLALRLFA